MWNNFVIYVGSGRIPDNLLKSYFTSEKWAGKNSNDDPEFDARDSEEDLKNFIICETPKMINSLYDAAKRIPVDDTEIVVFRGIKPKNCSEIILNPKLMDSWSYAIEVGQDFAFGGNPVSTVLVRKLTSKDVFLPMDESADTTFFDNEKEVVTFDKFPLEIVKRRFELDNKGGFLYLEMVPDETYDYRLPRTYDLVDIPACGTTTNSKSIQAKVDRLFNFNDKDKLKTFADFIFQEAQSFSHVKMGLKSAETIVCEEIDSIFHKQTKYAGKRFGYQGSSHVDHFVLGIDLQETLSRRTFSQKWDDKIKKIRKEVYKNNINLNVIPKPDISIFEAVKTWVKERKHSMEADED
jgi:hypothetical protein